MKKFLYIDALLPYTSNIFLELQKEEEEERKIKINVKSINIFTHFLLLDNTD